MKTNSSIKWITRTGILVALLISLQWGLGALTANNQFVVGSAVNLILIMAAIASGLYSAVTVAVISPFTAFMFGIGTPLFPLVPFIALGNLVLVLIWYLLAVKSFSALNYSIRMISALIVGSVIKFGVLYLSIVKVAIPYLLDVPEKQAQVLSATFSWPQLVTAAIGGAIAFLIFPVVKKTINK